MSSFLFSFAAAFALIGILGGELRFWDDYGSVIFPAMRYPVAIAAVLFAAAWFANGRKVKGIRPEPNGFATGLLALFVTNWLCDNYALLRGPTIRGEIVLGALITLAVLRARSFHWFTVALILGCLFCAWSFLTILGGAAITTDDHSAVLYRLQLLKENFPFIPHYNPLWNAGTDARDFFATGILNLFFIGYPLIASFELFSVYSILIAGVLFVLLPGMIYAAAREEQLSRLASALAALFALAPSLLWYRWALSYGAMGFIVSAALLPYCVSLCATMLSSEPLPAKKAAAVVMCLSLTLCWSLTGIALLPVIITGALLLPRLLRKKNVKSVIFALCLINLPWMIVFVNVSQVARFSSTEAATLKKADSSEAQTDKKRVVPLGKPTVGKHHGIKMLREFTSKANPALLLMGFAGLLLLPRAMSRRLGLVLTLWLLLLGAVIAPLKPQLELERMLLVLLLLLTLPAGAAAAQLFRQFEPRPCLRSLNAILVGGFILAGIPGVGFVLHNRSMERYSGAGKELWELSEAISLHGGEGRVFFSGFVLHELAGGHVAPLMQITGKPLVASSPIHNLWRYTDAIPPEFRERKEEGVEEYLDLMNATAVLAHESAWKKYFGSHPDRYETAYVGPSFTLYRRQVTPNYFLQGSGEVLEQTTYSVRLRLDSPEAVIKFIHYPFLTSSQCTLTRHTEGNETHLIRITECAPGTELEIRAVNAFKRVLGVKGT